MKSRKKVAESATSAGAVWVLVIVGFFSFLGIDTAGDEGWLSGENVKMLTKLVIGGLIAAVVLIALVRRAVERE